MSTVTDVGYRNPPASTRFQKGQSGHPKGRPRGRRNGPPYEAVLSQMVTITEDGVERRVTAAEAFLLYLFKRALEGDSTAARLMALAVEKARAARGAAGVQIRALVHVPIRPGSVSLALEALGMGRKLDRYRDSARMVLEPWVVEQALARLGDRRLTQEEQAKVVQAVRTPHKVRWPEWWVVRP